MEITNPQEVLNNNQMPPQLQDAANVQNDQPPAYKGTGGGAPLGYVPKLRIQVPIRMKEEEKAVLDEHVRKRRINNAGYSMNAFVLEAILEKIHKDNTEGV